MGAPVILTPQAQEDLGGIVAFIARHNPRRAHTFGDELLEKAFALGAQPAMGRVVPDLDDPAVREIVHGAYRIIYRVFNQPTRIFILRFWHGARGTPRIMED